MTDPKHHPGEEILLDYADGSLAEAVALVVATHLALCPQCRNHVALLEAIGGALLEDGPSEPISEVCRAAVMSRLDERTGPGPAAPITVSEDPVRIPEPLRSYLGAPLAVLDWRPVIPGLDEVDLGLGRAPMKTRLVRIRAGSGVPRHSHTGFEFSLVLAGGFHDCRGRFRRGDALLDDAAVEHRPVADRHGDCVCLTVTDAPLRLTGFLTRFLNPLLRW